MFKLTEELIICIVVKAQIDKPDAIKSTLNINKCLGFNFESVIFSFNLALGVE